MRGPWGALALLAACAPPPAVVLDDSGTNADTDPPAPSISIVYPEPGAEVRMHDCVLEAPIVVEVVGIELVEPGAEDVPGEGHWHGGPALDGGYCVSSRSFCEGAPALEDGKYDGTGLSPGPRKLFVELVNNVHASLGARAEVEVELVNVGLPCP